MKVAITCDQLVERRPVHRMIELLCSMYPDAVIYTLAHQPGKVLGPIEMHSIRSSFLSNIVESEDDLRQKSYLIPQAAKKLSIPCSTELIINISSGFSHGISHCEKTAVFNYFFTNDYNLPSKSFLEKVFKSFVKNYAKKSREKKTHQVQSHEGLGYGIEVVRPFFNFEDYMFHENESTGNLAVINPGQFTLNELKKMSDILQSRGLKVIILGDKLKIEGVEFLKNTCSGELAPLFEMAKVVIEGNSLTFPDFALSSFASGRRVLVKDSLNIRSYLGMDLPIYFNSIDQLQILDFNGRKKIGTKQLRDHAARYSQLLFKTGMMRQLKNMGFPYQSQH